MHENISFKIVNNYTRWDTGSIETWVRGFLDKLPNDTTRYRYRRGTSNNDQFEVDLFELSGIGTCGVKVRETRAQNSTRLTLADPASIGESPMDRLATGVSGELPDSFYLTLTWRLADLMGFYIWYYTDRNERINRAEVAAKQMLAEGRRITWSSERTTTKKEAALASKKKTLEARSETAVRYISYDQTSLIERTAVWQKNIESYKRTLREMKKLGMECAQLEQELRTSLSVVAQTIESLASVCTGEDL